MNLTEKYVSKLRPVKTRIQVYDDAPGFCVRVEPNGRKFFGWYAKVNGKPRYRALGEFPFITVDAARTEAAKWTGVAAEWKRSGFAGEDPFEKKHKAQRTITPTFRELVDAYITQHIRETANSPERAEYHVTRFRDTHLADWLDRPVDQIAVEDVLAVKKAVLATKTKNARGGRVAANRIVEFVRTLYNWSAGHKNGRVNFWPAENPAKDVELFPEKKRDRFLQPDELVRFNTALKDEPSVDLRDFLLLALATGARRSNIMSMRWADVSRERRNWRIPISKSGEAYDVSLTPAALEVLERRRSEIPDETPFVFPSHGRSGHLIDLKNRWDDFRKRAGIPDVRVHDLRRTCGSYMAIAGVSLQKIGRALGHRSLVSTEIYSRLHEEAVAQARADGEAKMAQMVAAAAKRLKGTARKQKMLTAGAA